MAERAPASVWFYLEANEAALFKQLHAARMGGSYEPDEHDKLIEAGFLEIEEFNAQPDGTCMNDVRLASKGERELVRLVQKSRNEFESRRRAARRDAGKPHSPLVASSSHCAVSPEGRRLPAGRPSRLVPEGATYRPQAGITQPEPSADGQDAEARTVNP